MTNRSNWNTKVLLLSLSFSFNFPMSLEKGAGIDVSIYQGSINWEKVANAGITFAVARATVGQGKQDPNFVTNWQGMRQYISTPAAYHYFKGQETAASQYANINSSLSKTDFDKKNDILAIDVESAYNTGTPTVMAETLNDLLLNLSDYKNVYIYTNYYFWEYNVSWSMFDFSNYNLWIAHHSNYTSKITPLIPTTWKSKGYTWWQYSDTGEVDGIVGNVDLDKMS